MYVQYSHYPLLYTHVSYRYRLALRYYKDVNALTAICMISLAAHRSSAELVAVVGLDQGWTKGQYSTGTDCRYYIFPPTPTHITMVIKIQKSRRTLIFFAFSSVPIPYFIPIHPNKDARPNTVSISTRRL